MLSTYRTVRIPRQARDERPSKQFAASSEAMMADNKRTSSMTIQETLHSITQQIAPLYHESERATIALWILEKITNMSHIELITHSSSLLTEQQQKTLDTFLHEHIVDHKPLQYLIGSVPFLDLEIRVRPPILIPRPETEEWCIELIEQLSNLPHQSLTILDMCTGSGCIGLSLASALPASTIYAVDISPFACELTRDNALSNHISNVQIIQSDLFSSLPANVKFDLIVSNPPYISGEEYETLDESVKNWEDPRALVAQENGLEILKKIIFQSRVWLKPNLAYLSQRKEMQDPAIPQVAKEMQDLDIPQLAVEIGYNQGTLVQALFEEAGYSNVKIHQDFAGKDRLVSGNYYAINSS